MDRPKSMELMYYPTASTYYRLSISKTESNLDLIYNNGSTESRVWSSKDDLSVKIITSGSVFSLPGGHYYCAAAVANMPNSSYGYVEVATWENEKIIKVYDLKANANIYLNTYANGAWAGWTVK